jgi:fucose permease
MIARQERTDFRPVLVAFATFITFGMAGSLLNVAWPFMSESFGVPLEAFGLLAFTATSASLVASFSSGRVVAWLGAGRLLMMAVLLYGIGLLALGLVPAWVFLVAMMLIPGMGAGLLDSGMNLYFAQNHSPRLMNWLHAAFGLGSVFGPLVMTWVIEQNFPWQYGYLATACIFLILAVIYSQTVGWWRARPVDEADGTPVQTPPLHATLREPLVWLSIALFVLIAGIEVTAAQWSFPLFNEARGVEVAAAGFWVSFYWASFTAGRVIFGIFADAVPVQTALRLSMMGVIAGALLLWWNPVNAVGFAGLAIIGFGLAPIFPLMISATPERLGRGHATNAVGFQVGAASLGIALLPSLAGVLAGWITLEIVGPFLAAAGGIMLLLYLLGGTRRIAA